MFSRARSILSVVIVMVAAGTAHAAVEGRYVYYGNPLSPFMETAEIEVFSGGVNVIAGCPECLSPDYLFKLYRGKVDLLVDGDKDTGKRHLELISENSETYSDSTLAYCAVEADMGKTMPIEKIDIYRARYTYRRGAELGWRYLLVLDETRKIVAWETFNVFHAPHPRNEGVWSFVPRPAEGAPAGLVVPPRSRSWLSEAEFIRDFLGKPVVDQTAPTDEQAGARLKRFERRNEPAEIDKLGDAFFRTVELDRPNLTQVKALVEKRQYAEALEAFKVPFFETIGVLVGKDAFEYTWGYDADSRDTMRIRDLSNHVYGDKKTLTVTQFRPGLMPPSRFTYPFQMRPLLLAYSSAGDQKLLQLWQEMLDDWSIGFQDAADRNPKLREHFVLTGGVLHNNFKDLAQTAAENPGFVKDLSGATLARFLMPIVEEIPVSIWRVWRKCVFNHTYNATGGSWERANLLADFRAGTRFQRELRQQMLRLHTLSQYRDGPMVEVGDEGHFVFNYLAPAKLYGQLCASQPYWFTPAREAYLLDLLRQAELVSVRHTSPSGIGSRWAWARTLWYPTFGEDRYNLGRAKLQRGDPVADDSLCSLLQRASIMQEPEPKAIANTVYGWGHVMDQLDAKERRKLRAELLADRYQRRPGVLSDWLPYSGCYYFRRGWAREDSFLHMLKPANANSNLGGHNRTIKAYEALLPTSYRFQDYATPLISVFATEIDGQGPCAHHGRYPSGSKQYVFTQAVEKPQPRRWYTDGRLDFGEAVYEGVYHNIYRYRERVGDTEEHILRYEDDPVLVKGVTTTRQIIQVRPARLFLQIERVAYASADETHTNRIPATLLLTEPGPETKKTFSNDQFSINADTRTVSMRNPGNPGVTVVWCGQPDLSFKPYTVNTLISKFWPQPDPEKVDPKKDAELYEYGWGRGWPTLNGDRRTTGRAAFAQWQARGESVLLGALYANAPGEEPVKTVTDISTDTVAGLRAETAKGVTVTLVVARHIPATLEAGPVSAEGEALLLMETEGASPTVMILGGKHLMVAGRPMALETPDMTFDPDGSAQPLSAGSQRPILRPLDPPTIGPQINTFIDKTTVTLTTASPAAVIRYTTKMPASRMNDFHREAEKLKRGTTTLAVSADLLALREEEGADWQEYTGPFEITDDALVRARTFRRGLHGVPTLRAAGTEVSMVSYGFFFRKDAKPAQRRRFRRLKPGLNYEYLEGRWFALWSYTDILPARKTGNTQTLLDVSMRETDGPFAVRYNGYIDIPADGVYTFYGPDEFINNICAPGYDLRVYIDGEQWDLGQTWHGRGMWSVPLDKGLHTFRLTFADARAKDTENQRVDLAMHYPYAQTTWKGVAPVLEVSGPGIERQVVPEEWLKR
ncbi:MAG: lipolytic enzyme, G-D-S-L [Lentisphaerae bacterium]|jgi:hypothetical protein|nr:lipolytic enzyme, G-D-S-L [Lentisphaerota bacterium]MBT4823488.1 lipolytic enzyme, G-D-S-L [Lentisphaerota bacterium]MBT5610269.1 lipolytic enzyme, G-D-S-L [Lentisphaerota bacterium]MBT7060313.1 lipolytic enzyme, G-D-S-L [Lentisphaerota bacterium]MBT7843973.1 lipolytic enzyme, G-D-S-L [Lentisphaerota bacterium]